MQRGLLAAAVALLAVLGTGSAGATTSTAAFMAKDGGRCAGGGSTYALAVSRYDRATLRVRFRIANSTASQTWQIFGSDNGTRIFAVKRVVSSHGTASVRRRIADRKGVDKVKVAANNLDTGEACSAAASF